MSCQPTFFRRLVWLPAWAASAAALAQTVPAETVPAPTWKVGDQWVYELTVNPGDTCTKNLATGASQTVEVKVADAEGYELERNTQGNPTRQRLAPDFSSSTKVGFNDAKGDHYGFPMPRAKPWKSDQISASSFGTVKNELLCEHRAREKLVVPAGEFEVVPIVCEGTWTNLNYRTSDKATWKYWYAPAVRNFVKTSTFTYYQGNPCVDLVWALKAAR